MGRASKRKDERRSERPAADEPVRAARQEPAPVALAESLWGGSRKQVWLFALVVVAISAGVYVNTLSLEFTWDDDWLILENDRIDDPSYIRYMLFERERLWRPLKRMSFMLDYWLWGPDEVEEPKGLYERLKGATGFHLTNLILQVGVCLALYALAMRLGLAPLTAAVAAVLFAVHPVHVEGVANISHRKEPMSLLFYLLAFLAYMGARRVMIENARHGELFTEWVLRAIASPRFWINIVSSLLFYALGMLSKEVGAVMFPATVAVYELAVAREPRKLRLRALATVLGPPALIVLTLFTVKGYISRLPAYFGPKRIQWITEDKADTYGPVFLTAVKSVGESAKVLLWPQPLYLDRDFPLAGVPAEGDEDGPRNYDGVATGFVTLLVMGAGIAWGARRAPMVCFGMSWLLLNLLPVTNFIPTTHWLFAERFVYVPSVGFAILIAVGLEALWLGRAPELEPALQRAIAAGLLLTLVSVHAVLTIKQNRVWENSKTLWAQTLKEGHNPDSYRALHGYGLELFNAGDYEQAEDYYRRSIESFPSYPEPRYALALLLLNSKRYEEAIEHAKIHTRLKSHDPEPYIIIGNAELARATAKMREPGFRGDYRGLYKPASKAYSRAIHRDGGHASAMYNLANVLNVMGRTDEARALLERSLELSESRDARALLASLQDGTANRYATADGHFQAGRYDEALEVLRDLLDSEGESTAVLNRVANVFIRKKEYESALEYLERSFSVDSEQPQVERTRDQILQYLLRRDGG